MPFFTPFDRLSIRWTQLITVPKGSVYERVDCKLTVMHVYKMYSFITRSQKMLACSNLSLFLFSWSNRSLRVYIVWYLIKWQILYLPWLEPDVFSEQLPWNKVWVVFSGFLDQWRSVNPRQYPEWFSVCDKGKWCTIFH